MSISIFIIHLNVCFCFFNRAPSTETYGTESLIWEWPTPPFALEGEPGTLQWVTSHQVSLLQMLPEFHRPESGRGRVSFVAVCQESRIPAHTLDNQAPSMDFSLASFLELSITPWASSFLPHQKHDNDRVKDEQSG